MSFSAVVLAKVGKMALEELVADSKVIVVATVSKVEDSPANTKSRDKRLSAVRVATAEVIETWKGAPAREVSFRASPTWTCDVADAETGEQVVLFLTRREGAPSLTIGHSGRGRMPSV